jgi:predicted phosphodiesterase
MALALAACSRSGSGSGGGDDDAGAAPGAGSPASTAGRFSFGVIGDYPYTADQVPKFDRLIESVNEEKPDLVLHVGDLGAQPCTDDALRQAMAKLNTISVPVVYTPGDNEWTDCHETGAEPRERLARIRQLFFATRESLGAKTLTVSRQADYPENSRFDFRGVTFVAVHEVGSNNGMGRAPDADAEATIRSLAGQTWVAAGFAAAKEAASRAIVVFFQADPNFDLYAAGVPTGHTDFLKTLERESIGFKRPVLLVHGDSHIFRADKPLVGNSDKRTIENVTRFENFGSPNVHWSRVTVDTSTPDVFAFNAQIVGANILEHSPPR